MRMESWTKYLQGNLLKKLKELSLYCTDEQKTSMAKWRWDYSDIKNISPSTLCPLEQLQKITIDSNS